MKTLITKFLAMSGMAIALLASCKKDELKVVAPTTGTGAGLTLSTTTPALTKANLTATALSLTATTANYGYNAATSYVVQFAVKGTNFATVKELGLTKDVLNKTYTVREFNDLLLSMNIPTGKPAQIEARLKASLSSTAGITYSSVVTITATPFDLASYIYVPGAYQGWVPASADSLESATGNGVYTGIINFTAGKLDFKVTPKKNWDVAYGKAGDGKISTSGGDITAPAVGVTQVTVNLNDNTITYDKPAFYFSIVGDATVGGWGTDTDLKYVYATGTWEVTTALASTGKFKIRMNHDWGTSFGLPGTPDGKTLTSANGADIPVASNGTYKITFTPTYTVEGQTTKVNATAAYTLVKQ